MPLWNSFSINFGLLDFTKVVKIDSAKQSLQVFRQLENYSSPRPRLNFLSRSFLIQISRFTRTVKPEFETPFYSFWFYAQLHSRSICLWISPCVHQCFAHYQSIAPRKISNLSGLSLVSSWKPCLFCCAFCYLQNVDIERSHKNGSESLCFEYRHYWSQYLLSSFQ